MTQGTILLTKVSGGSHDEAVTEVAITHVLNYNKISLNVAPLFSLYCHTNLLGPVVRPTASGCSGITVPQK